MNERDDNLGVITKLGSSAIVETLGVPNLCVFFGKSGLETQVEVISLLVVRWRSRAHSCLFNMGP